jgi:hypothetical protein
MSTRNVSNTIYSAMICQEMFEVNHFFYFMRVEILVRKDNKILKRPKIRILHYNSYPTTTDPNSDPDKVRTRTQNLGCSYPLFVRFSVLNLIQGRLLPHTMFSHNPTLKLDFNWPRKGRFPFRILSIGSDWTRLHLVLSAPPDRNKKVENTSTFYHRITGSKWNIHIRSKVVKYSAGHYMSNHSIRYIYLFHHTIPPFKALPTCRVLIQLNTRFNTCSKTMSWGVSLNELNDYLHRDSFATQLTCLSI